MADASSSVDTVSSPSALFNLEPIDVADAWEHELLSSFQTVSSLTSGKSAAEAHDILQQQTTIGHGPLVGGLVYGMLTEHPGDVYFRHLSLVSRDGYAYAISRLQLVATSPRFPQLRPQVRTQLLWAVGALVRSNAQAGVDALVLALMRQIRGGDTGTQNVGLLRGVLDLLESNHAWMITHPVVVASSAYALTRLILDLGRVGGDLRTRCGALVARLVRERFADCAMVGRDLVRVLQDAARLPVIRDLWSDLIHRPLVISPLLSQGVSALLRVPTPRMFLASRLTFAMESRLLFILENVPGTGYTRNLVWFVHRYLALPESETLFVDVIRYICGVFHPSNSVLASNIVQRYAVLGSLLLYVRSQVVAANAKLALFYDWLFYDPHTDNIMNVEPGVLLMARSADRYPFLTASFVEFLAFVADAYAPSLAPDIRHSVALVMRDAIDKGVIPSLLPVYEQPRLGRSAKRHMQMLWSQLVPQDEPQPSTGREEEEEEEEDDSESVPPLLQQTKENNEELEPQLPAVNMPVVDLSTLDPVSRMFHEDSDSDGSATIDEPLLPLIEDAEPWMAATSEDSLLDDPSLWVFGSTLRDFITSKSPQAIPEILRILSQSEASTLAVARILAYTALQEEELEDIETNAELARMEEPEVAHDLLHVILTTVISTDGGRCLDLLVHLTRARVDVGFRWLLCCVDSRVPQLYSQYVARFASGTLSLALSRDLSTLQERFTGYFYEALPLVYAAFPETLPGSPRTVRSILALIDQPQVYRLTLLIGRGMLRLFGTKPTSIIADTMECDAFEQVCLWQLLVAEVAGDVRAVERIVRKVLPSLDPSSNSEAANGLLSLLRVVPPTPRLVETVVQCYDRSVAERSDLCGCVLAAWLQRDPAMLRRSVGSHGKLVDDWVERFAATRFVPGDLAIREMLTEPADEEPKEVAEMFTPEDSAGVKRKNSTPPPANVARQKSDGLRRLSLAKRRRRNVITSDDDDDDDEEVEDRDMQMSSSPVLSSSSLESEDSD
ncbi:hypothetical protein GGI20_000960 [Coemansia sp. BCRC 34301]|nr:hypothetical protein GGI20_000960 [Coemansia sp. BCRC 34301]